MKNSERAVSIAARYSKGSLPRLNAMCAAIDTIERKVISGDIVECGVWKGGHLMIARMMAPTRICWGFDTFAGMTKPTAEDVHRGGMPALARWKEKRESGQAWAAESLDAVRGYFDAEGLADDNLVRFVVGDVAVTLRDENNLPENIAILRLDTDWYESTKIELEVLYPRLRPGGILIVDDYGHWLGARKAVDEYFDRIIPNVRKEDRHRFVDYTCIVHTKA